MAEEKKAAPEKPQWPIGSWLAELAEYFEVQVQVPPAKEGVTYAGEWRLRCRSRGCGGTWTVRRRWGVDDMDKGTARGLLAHAFAAHRLDTVTK
jgi:hypothetical protein